MHIESKHVQCNGNDMTKSRNVKMLMADALAITSREMLACSDAKKTRKFRSRSLAQGQALAANILHTHVLQCSQ